MRRALRVGLLVLVLLSTVLCIAPLLVPIPPLADVYDPGELADADSRFIDVGGIQVHYKIAGQGPPVFLLLHGFGASTFSWREVMQPLAEQGTAIAFDRPAFGLTERPTRDSWKGSNPYTASSQVDLTLALLDALGIEKAILVGNSAGGTVSMRTALRAPDRVAALVLISPAVYESGPPSWVRPLYQLPQTQRLGPLVVRYLVPRLEGALPSAWHDPSKIDADILAGYKLPLQVAGWDRAFWEFNLASTPLDMEPTLPQLTTPTLVVTGDDDRWVPTSQSIRLASELPNADLVVIPNCGHVAQEECPQEFLEAVISFLGRLQSK